MRMTTEFRSELRDAIRRIRERLERARTEHNVDAFAFYVGNDPFVPSFLRCLAAPGAACEEAASHFRFLPFPGDEDHRFVADVSSDSLRHYNGEVADHLIAQDPSRNRIFGDFVTREQIESRAWFVKRDLVSQEAEALLTVNYRTRRDEQEWNRHDKGPLHALFQELVTQLEEIETLLKEMYTPVVWDLTRILNVALPTELVSTPSSSPQEALTRLLTLATEALLHISSDTPPEQWCGTIYTLDLSRKHLRLRTHFGETELPPHEFDVLRGEGVVSWVAVRAQAVRISDLDKSPQFRAIHRELVPGIRSQLAVPMIREGQVMGVLSLESPEPNVFSLTSVGFLTRVASLAAVQLGFQEVREERDQYLKAIYAAKRREFSSTPLPTLEELERDSVRQ